MLFMVLVGLKTHSKITLVVRREGDGIRRYVHLELVTITILLQSFIQTAVFLPAMNVSVKMQQQYLTCFRLF